MKQINESFKKKYANLSEASEVEETLTPQQELRKALENKLDELESKGTLNIKDYEIGFQDVIENLYPDKEWWEVTDCNIFMSLFNSRQPEETIMDIIANMKVNKDAQVEESVNSVEYVKWVQLPNKKWKMWGGSNDSELDPEFLDRARKQNGIEYLDAKIAKAGEYPDGVSEDDVEEIHRYTEDVDWDAYAEIQKGAADEYKARVKEQITPAARKAFDTIKKHLEEDANDTPFEGDYYPEWALMVLDGGEQYHMNKYMDLTYSNILDMIRDNATPEAAIDVLFDKYNADSAYSWADNFVEVLKRVARDNLGESKKITERNLTKAERHNRNMDRIFDTKKAQDKKYADFLLGKGYSAEDVEKLRQDDKLSDEIAKKFTPNGKQSSDILGKILNGKKITESLTEGHRGFVRKYRGCSIHDMGDTYVVTNPYGLNIGQSPTESGCEGLIDEYLDGTLKEDTVKTSKGKWTNKGDTGKTHGTFNTKKEADAQRNAMFANGFKGEALKESRVQELSKKYGWPLKINARGEIATLVGAQPLNDGKVDPLYRFPGGVSVVGKDELIPVQNESKSSNESSLWHAACNGDDDFLKKYYADGGKPNIRHNAFGKRHSLIMGALRNGQYDTIKLLTDNGETILRGEQKEFDKLMAKKDKSLKESKGDTIVGVYGISNNMAIYVYEIVYGIDDEIVWAWSDDTDNKQRSTMQYDFDTDDDARAYFMAGDMKVYLDEVMRTNITESLTEDAGIDGLPKSAKNIANEFKNYSAFEANFAPIIIVKQGKNYFVYKTNAQDYNDYLYNSNSKDNIDGWLYGAVQCANGWFDRKPSSESLTEGWRGTDVELVSHGNWSDPDLVWGDYTFNYWDIEDALWSMFLEETGHNDSESDDPDVEAEFDKYVQDNYEWYLSDVIDGGYFDKGSTDWHDRYKKESLTEDVSTKTVKDILSAQSAAADVVENGSFIEAHFNNEDDAIKFFIDVQPQKYGFDDAILLSDKVTVRFVPKDIPEVADEPKMSTRNPNRLRVCDHCLAAIESREGNQITKTVSVDAEDDEDSKCDWCEETGFDTLYDIY